jgi:hypothetical protein
LVSWGFGLGKGFIFPAALKASCSHLPGRKGIAIGMVVCGLGCGSFVFTTLTT